MSSVFDNIDIDDTGHDHDDSPATVAFPSLSSVKVPNDVMVFDIETVPDKGREELFGLEPVQSPSPETPFAECPPIDEMLGLSVPEIKQKLFRFNPDNKYLGMLGKAEGEGKNRKGVTDAIIETHKAKESAGKAGEERSKLLSTTPEFCRIVALGWSIGDQPIESIVVDGAVTEIELLERFWWLVRDVKSVVGYNIAGFDLPVLQVRSAILGIRELHHGVSIRQFDSSPWKSEVIDLMDKRFGRRGLPKDVSKLKNLCRLYGINPPAGDMDGSQVAAAYEAGEIQKIHDYVRSDVWVERELLKKMAGVFFPWEN